MPLKYPVQTKQHREASAAQVRLLDEAAVRIAAIDSILAQGQPWPPSLGVEFSFLQLRMLCETVALLCLVAHGDIEATRTSKLQKDYAADNIIKKLEQLHANFYPHPVTVSSTPNAVHMERIASGRGFCQCSSKKAIIRRGFVPPEPKAGNNTRVSGALR